MKTETGALDPVAAEAVAWWVRTHASDDATLREACAQWRDADPRHEYAWSRLERLACSMRELPSGFAHAQLSEAPHAQPRSPSRRKLLRGACTALVLGGVGMAAYEGTPWYRLFSDYSTGTGERRRVDLPDGIRIDLASDSAITTQLNTDHRAATLWHGQLAANVPLGTPDWPLRLRAGDALIEASQARFAVQMEAGQTRIDVYEGRLRMLSDGAPRELDAGAAITGRARQWQEAAAEGTDGAWTDGLLVARQDTLRDVLAQVSRYRHGIVRVDPAVADLRVSGVFSLDDTDRTLGLLQQSLPIVVRRHSGWWISVEAQPSA